MIIALSVTFLFLVLRFTVTLFNFISNPKLSRVNKPYDSLVSILIPARNEEENIIPLLNSIALQDYSHYEVIVYDDNSTDGTFAICTSFAKKHSQIEVIKGGKLPPGWTGKNYACDQLAARARGEYFLFLDADTTVEKGLINSAIHRMHQYRLTLLSVFANQQMESSGEKVTVPLLHYWLLNLLPLRAINLIKQATPATASGQFMLFEAVKYRKHRWHNEIKERAVEDADIMRMVKQSACNGELLLANNMISCRMYKSYHTAINGLSKNILATFGNSVFALLFYIIVIIGGPMLVITTLNLGLIFFMCGLIVLTRVMVSLTSGQNALLNLVLHPLQMINLTIIAFIAIQRHLTRTQTWKGRYV